jgi:capsular exopolysaccharide synthesis family protein
LFTRAKMSLIFDALQRSEAERSGVALPALTAATEVLQLAELHAASERETAVQFEQLNAPESLKGDASCPPPTVPQAAAAVEAPVDADLSVDDKYLDAFSQFQSLQVVVPSQNRLVCLTDNESLAAEKFRYLGVRLQHLRRDRPLKKVLITSTIPAEGKSMVAANLACTLARRTQQKTLLLEGDLRRPSLSQLFGLERIPGISEWLQAENSLMTSIYYLEGPGLWILPAGSAPKNPLELLQSGKLSALMDQLTAWFDWIIIDSPPVLPLADTSVWMRVADGILLVARQGTTEKRQLQRGLEALEPKKLIGALLNGSKNATRSDYYYRPPTASRPNDRSI